jgi:hypothetical protein
MWSSGVVIKAPHILKPRHYTKAWAGLTLRPLYPQIPSLQIEWNAELVWTQCLYQDSNLKLSVRVSKRWLEQVSCTDLPRGKKWVGTR